MMMGLVAMLLDITELGFLRIHHNRTMVCTCIEGYTLISNLRELWGKMCELKI